MKRLLIRHGRVLASLLFVVTLVVIAQVSGWRDLLSVDYLRQQLQENRAQGLALFVLLFALGNLFQVPGWIFLAAAVFAFGRTTGGVATYLAASLSCLFTFLTVRMVGGDIAGQLNNKYAVRLLARLHAHPIRNVAILRTLFQTLPSLNYALALSGIGVRKYLLGTLLGLPLPIAVYCLFFDFLVNMAHKV